MHSVNEFINSLKHVFVSGDSPETAAERHQRYLRERKLQGRKVGGSTPAPKLRPAAPLTKALAKPLPQKALVKKASVNPAVKRAATEARIKDMQARLEKLRELLKQLVEKAQERSGVDEPDEKTPSTSTKSDKKPLTASEKNEAAKKSEERRKQNPDKVLDQKAKRLDTQIKNVEEKIAEMHKKLVDSP